MSLTKETYIDETNLRKEILELEKLIKQKKEQLFINRLYEMFEKNDYDTISNIKIDVNPIKNNWIISYKFQSSDYDMTDYLYDTIKNTDDQEYTRVSSEKKSNISFGKNDKYFIKGGIKYNIYKNSKGDLRIINLDYDLELDMDEQYSLIYRYAYNKNIPECIALRIFLYMIYNKWDDDDMTTYLSVV